MSSTKVEDLVKSKIKEAMEKRKITTSTEHWLDVAIDVYKRQL